MNPTCAVLEERMSKLEGGVAAMAVSSGQAASTFSIQKFVTQVIILLVPRPIWWNMESFNNTMKEMGIECRFVDPKNLNNLKMLLMKNQMYLEKHFQIQNFKFFLLKKLEKLEKNITFLNSDNTAAPYICKPLNHGANIVVYSTTKYIGGHGLSIGGLLIDGGNFDWEKAGDRFKMLNTPDPSYHGAVWSEAAKPLGPIAYILRARVILLRDLGSSMSPFNAFTFIQGLETLPLRMQRHCENASRNC